VAEWSNATALKAVVPARVPWVQIPPSPPFIDLFLMSYSAFVQSKFLKTVATVSSFVFVSLLLLNPGIYSDMVKKETNVSANFLANEYSTTEDEYVIDSSLGDLEYIDAIQDAPSSGSLQSYVVQSRDTLSDISKKYQISVDQLKNLNNIIDESSVRPGSVVYISSQP
jgi:hypothetical protein